MFSTNKRLSIRPIEFESPPKKQVKLTILKNTNHAACIFNTPTKKSFPTFNLDSPSPGPSNLENISRTLKPFDLMKTPSPKKRLNSFIICQNVGLPTPGNFKIFFKSF